jgi:hypothetical protein
MPNQIFKKTVSPSILMELLDKICLKTEKYYLFDINAYKKLLFYNLQAGFCENLKDYYHLGKQFYLTRKMKYNHFTTVIRQICKLCNIMYTSQIKYNESKYNIDYLIYFNNNE